MSRVPSSALSVEVAQITIWTTQPASVMVPSEHGNWLPTLASAKLVLRSQKLRHQHKILSMILTVYPYCNQHAPRLHLSTSLMTVCLRPGVAATTNATELVVRLILTSTLASATISRALLLLIVTRPARLMLLKHSYFQTDKFYCLPVN